MNLFALDPGLAIWTWVTFGMLCLIVAKWVVPPLLKSLEARERLLAGSVDDALALKDRLESVEAEREEILAEARARGEALVEEARRRAEALGRELAAQARRDAEALVEGGRARWTEERRAALDSLAGEMADFALDCASSILGTTLTGDREREWALNRARSL